MKCIYLIFCLGIPFLTKAQDCNSLPGKWINEQGSVLIIDAVREDGRILGTYASSTGVDGKVFPLSGWINTSSDQPDEVNISFSVKWTGYGSITSWTGYCLQHEGIPEIKTIWNLVRSGKQFNWERILTNASTFKAPRK